MYAKCNDKKKELVVLGWGLSYLPVCGRLTRAVSMCYFYYILFCTMS